jgi:hypothetical protein
MNAWVAAGSAAGSAAGAVLVVLHVGDRFNTTIHARLDRLPHRVLRLAIRRLDTDVRADIAPDWTAELDAILQQHRGRLPLSRVFAGARFAAGLLRTAKTTSGYLAAKPHLLDTALRVALQGSPQPETTRDQTVWFVSSGFGLLCLLITLVLIAGPARTTGLALAILALGVCGWAAASIARAMRGLVLYLRRRLRGISQPSRGLRPRSPAHSHRSFTAVAANVGAAPAGPNAQQPPDSERADHDTDGSPDLRPPPGRAIRHSGTRATYTRHHRNQKWFLGIALAVWVAGMFLDLNPALWLDGTYQRAQAAWTPTRGTVLTVSSYVGAYAPTVSLVITYSVAGEPQPRHATLHLSISHRDHYTGERINVLYNPTNPAQATIAGERRQSLLVTIALTLTIWYGSNGFLVGLFYWVRGRRLRRVLARNNWQPCRYRHLAITGRTEKDTRHVLALEPELAGSWATVLVEVAPIAHANNDSWQPTGNLWIAGDPRTQRRVIAGTPDPPTIALYRATRLHANLADQLLAAPPPPPTPPTSLSLD